MKNYLLTDILSTINNLPLATYSAWGDVKARYRRSVLGPLWIVLGTAIAVVGLGFLWSALMRVDRTVFIPSITLGLVIWQFLSGTITESTILFTSKAKLINNIKIPYLIFPIQLLLRQLINFAHNIIVVVVVLIIFPPPLSFIQWLVIPGILLVVANLLWISVLLGLLTARFRDFEQLITAFMPILFFLSPVIFRPTQLGMNEKIAWLNPFTYMITLIRDPLQGTIPPSFVYWGAIAILIIGTSFSLWILNRCYPRITFWI